MSSLTIRYDTPNIKILGNILIIFWITLPALPVLRQYCPVLTGPAISILTPDGPAHLFPDSLAGRF